MLRPCDGEIEFGGALLKSAQVRVDADGEKNDNLILDQKQRDHIRGDL